MSWEGYAQCICTNGHYFELGMVGHFLDPHLTDCEECEAKSEINVVDTTNGCDSYQDGRFCSCNEREVVALSADTFRFTGKRCAGYRATDWRVWR